MKEDLLKTCPICNGIPDVIYDDGYEVVCRDCGVSGPITLGEESDDRDEAILLWNTRADDKHKIKMLDNFK